jgi:ubiquinone/menaquinone biosynthesis C-methylase UbiE
MDTPTVKDQVRQFYDQVGWKVVSDGTYQNARYEDLRPVAREYIHKCHLRVKKCLKPQGRFLLDAGSGPIQYPEYLTYSADYQRRVCVDLSIVALQEARQRIGEHGLFVVADVANLPFRPEVFDGIVTLHTFHHLPGIEQEKAYLEIQRVLAGHSTAVVVNGWTESPLMKNLSGFMKVMENLGAWINSRKNQNKENKLTNHALVKKKNVEPTGTFIQKIDAIWLIDLLSRLNMSYEIRVWRSVNVRFLRAVIHSALGGVLWLRWLFWLEECFPGYFGKNGQYPLIVIRKD